MQAVFFPKPDAPVKSWSSSARVETCRWDNMPLMAGPPEIEVEFAIAPGYTLEESLRYLYTEVCHKDDLDGVKPTLVMRYGPATVVSWSDGTRTSTKIRGEDREDHYLALLNCYWRKVERNKGRSDIHYEDNKYVSAIASGFCTPDDMREAARCLEYLADVREIETKE